MDKRLPVYMKYGEKADTCSFFATVCPNHFEMDQLEWYMIEII